MLRILKTLSLFLFALFTFFSCKKEKETIPNVHVDLYININDPSFVNLKAVGGWAYITGGSRGIVVYQKSPDAFAALDRHCTYDPTNPCGKVEVDSSNILLVDPCCSSKFIITDGSVNVGPASVPLKQYQTNFEGSVLHIYN